MSDIAQTLLASIETALADLIDSMEEGLSAHAEQVSGALERIKIEVPQSPAPVVSVTNEVNPAKVDVAVNVPQGKAPDVIVQSGLPIGAVLEVKVPSPSGGFRTLTITRTK